MAITALTSRYSLLAAHNLNKQADGFLYGNQLITPLHITDSSTTSIVIEDFYCSSNENLIYVNDATVVFDPGDLSIPYHLYLFAESALNTPFDPIESFETLATYIFAYGAAVNVLVSEEGGINNTNCLEFDKAATGTDAGLRVDQVVDLSEYNAVRIKIKIPDGDATDIESVNIILDETGNLSKYTKFVITNVHDGWWTYVADFSSPYEEVNSPTLGFFVRAFVYLKTNSSTKTLTNVKYDELQGCLIDPNKKNYDDYIYVYVTDATDAGTRLATYDGTNWSIAEDVDIKASSQDEYVHINTDGCHFPPDICDIIKISKASATNTLITQADIVGINPDYYTSNEINLNASIHNAIEPNKRQVEDIESFFIYSDSIRRNRFSQHGDGVNQYIDTSSAITTAELGLGYYFGDITETVIQTTPIIQASGEIETITVGSRFLHEQAPSNITYDLIINDTTTHTDLNLYETYDISNVYDDYGLLGTSLKLRFHIPAVSGGDFWTVKTNYPESQRGNRLITISNRNILSLVENSLRSYSEKNDTWNSLTSPFTPMSFDDPHPASRENGMRIIPTASNKGEYYNISTNSWTAIGNVGVSDGRPVDINGFEFYNIQAPITTRFLDLAETTITTTGVGDSWKCGAAFRGFNNNMYVHGGESFSNPTFENKIKEFNFTTEVWSAGVATGVDQGHQGYAQLNNKKLYSIGGRSNSTNYINNNNEYDEINQVWSSKTAVPASRAYQSCGATKLDKILNIIGETTAGALTANVYEYTPNYAFKFFGFGLKISFSALFGEADHVGYWQIDSYPTFYASTESEKQLSGYWTLDNGLIAFGRGTYWGYYLNWADDPWPTYPASTFDERWQGGYWSDTNGKIGTDDGPLWE